MSVRTIGIIDNLRDIPSFVASRYESASAAEVMAATGGNTGNVAFVHGVHQILGDRLRRIEWGTPADVINREIDHVVVCCANQLGAHVDLGSWADKIAQIDKPVTLIGLGAQAPDTSRFPTVPEGTLRFLERVGERRVGASTNIAVRGQFTADFLASIGIEAAPIGCPSLHVSADRHLGRRIVARQAARIERVAVAAGNPWHGPSAPLEKTLVEIVMRWRGDYVLQHPEVMLQYAYGETAAIDDRARRRFAEVYGSEIYGESIEDWFRRYAAVFVDAPNWMRYLGRFDRVLGPRYHGVALGLQAGVAGCVFTIDSRTEELCSGTGVKSIPAGELIGLPAEEVVARATWSEGDGEAFDSIRTARAVAYLGFLEGNALASSPQLAVLAQP